MSIWACYDSTRGQQQSGTSKPRRKGGEAQVLEVISLLVAVAIAVNWLKDLKKAVEAARDSEDGQ